MQKQERHPRKFQPMKKNRAKASVITIRKNGFSKFIFSVFIKKQWIVVGAFSLLLGLLGTYTILSSHASSLPANCAVLGNGNNLNTADLDVCGYPSMDSTGPPAGTNLTPVSNVNCSNETINAISTSVSVTLGMNCIIENSRLTGGLIGGSNTQSLSGVQLLHDEISGPYTGSPTSPNCSYNSSNGSGGNSSDILWEGSATGITLDYDYLHCAAESYNGNGTIENSYIIADECWGPCGSSSTTHNEAIYIAGGGNGGTNIEHNTILNPWPQTAGIFGDDHAYGPIHNLTINNNLIADNDDNGAVAYGNAGDGDTNITVTNNRFAFVYNANMPIGGGTAASTWCSNYQDSNPNNYYTDAGGSGGSACSGSASAPTVSLSASPTSIKSGSNSTLSWSSTNATSCSASGGWSGSQGTSGSISVSPTTTTTYDLTCSGNGGISSPSAITIAVSSSGGNSVSGSTGSGGSSSGNTSSSGSSSSGGSSNLNTSAPKSSAPVSGIISVGVNSVGAKSVVVKVDGNTVPSTNINTANLSDGKHTVEVQITKPNGQVETQKRTITVNNHHSLWKNVLLKYGNTKTLIIMVATLVIIMGLVWLFIIKPRKSFSKNLLYNPLLVTFNKK